MTSKALETFDHAIQDATDLLDHFDALNQQPPPSEIEVLKRAGLVMALAALEIYFEDLLVETVELLCTNSSDERLSEFILGSLKSDLKVFHTPSTDRVKPIFRKYLGYDVTEGWTWNNSDPKKAKLELNRLAKKRGDIAHRSGRPVPGQPTQHAVTRDEMRKHIHFIKELVRTTDAYVQENSNK